MTTASPSASSSSSSASSSSANGATTNRNPNPNPNPNSTTTTTTNGPVNPTSSWWESLSKSRARILSLAPLLPPSASPVLTSLADSDRPALSFLSSPQALSFLSSALSSPSSGSGSDPLCHWLYDTLLSSPSDPDLPLLPLSQIPLLAHLYLSRLHSDSSPSLAGFEAVLLALYSSEAKARLGKPLLISLPDLSLPSLYHSPNPTSRNPNPSSSSKDTVGILSPPLEPHTAVKSTKRALIIGIALDCYYKKISQMPGRTKVDFCEFVSAWAGQDCNCRFELDDESSESFEEDGEIVNGIGRLGIRYNCDGERVARIPLPWELMQPVLRILGHCLLAPLNPQEVRDVASGAVRCVYARALHELLPQGILAARSLIQLDKSGRKAARDAVVAGKDGTGSNPATPGKPKRPEVLLVSK